MLESCFSFDIYRCAIPQGLCPPPLPPPPLAHTPTHSPPPPEKPPPPKIDYPTLDTPRCILEHRGASQSTAVHPSSPWGPGQAPSHACMCVCARCLPTPCGVSRCPPLHPSYPSRSQTHPATHLCPRRLRLPRKVQLSQEGPLCSCSALSLSLISLARSDSEFAGGGM